MSIKFNPNLINKLHPNAGNVRLVSYSALPSLASDWSDPASDWPMTGVTTG